MINKNLNMKYTINQYKELSERFNKQSLLQKILTIKQNPEIFELYTDGYNWRLRLEESAQELELDLLFQFEEFSSFKLMKDVFSLNDINIKELK